MRGSIRALALPGLFLASTLAFGAAPALAQEDLAQYEAEHARLVAAFQRCQQELQAFNQRQAVAAMNGYLLPPPPCSADLAAITERVAFLELRIYRLRSGDNQTPSATLMPNLASPGQGSGGGRYSSTPPDPAGRYDRQAVRGTSIYRDENGEEHELPTQNYYFRDRASGAIIGSNTPDPPDNYHDYERFQAAE